jgi:hypothetical protein
MFQHCDMFINLQCEESFVLCHALRQVLEGNLSHGSRSKLVPYEGGKGQEG